MPTLSPRLHPDGPRPTFEEMLLAGQAGCSDSQGRVLELVRPMLEAAASRLLPQRWHRKYDPGDLCQDVLLQAYRRFHAFAGRTESQFRCWVLCILRGRAIDFHRRQLSTKRDSGREVTLRAAVACAGRNADPATRLSCAEDLAELTHSLGRCSEEDRRVLELRYLRSWSYQRIGEEIGVSGDAARKRCGKARSRLHRSGL